mgnify:CR=1 FL=1
MSMFDQSGLTRRGFIKGSLAGGAALTMSSKLAFAEQVMTGRKPTIENIKGSGVKPGLVRMNLNENPLGPSPMAIKAVADHLFEMGRYGSQARELIQSLADFNGITLPEPDRSSQRSFFRSAPGPILTTASSSQALGLLTLAYLSRKGGEVIEAEFGYGQISRSGPMYKELFGVDINVIKAPMTKGYKHDLDAMAAAITPKTTMIAITNPNNPTGTLLTTEEIEAFVKKVPENVIVVIDEAYIHFAEGDKLPSSIPLATTYDNVATVRTFSKVYAMPSMRLGYCVSSQKIQREMMKYFTGGTSMLTNVAGTAAVQDIEHIQRSREVVWAFKNRLYEECEKMGWEYIPTQGTFVMVNIGTESRKIVSEMRKRNVWISSRRQDEFKNWIRVSAGTEDETEVFLDTLQQVMSSTI